MRSGDLGGTSHLAAPSNPAIVVSGDEMLIPLSLKQQQPSGNNLAFLSAYVSHRCFVVGCEPRSVAVRLNICCKLVRNETCLRNISVVLLDFQT